MKKLLSFIRLVSFLWLFPCLGISQNLDHIQGEILVQLSNTSSPKAFIQSLSSARTFQFNSRALELVSAPMHIWKLNFDHNQLHELRFLESIKANPLVINAQFNFYTENRTEPNDPLFQELWHLKNTGQNNGQAGIDLGAIQAWGITPGGLTYLGDTVVICIIDERFDHFHEDLEHNIWRNYADIPGNDVDDDGNGYVDDFAGWNINTNNDDIMYTSSSDWHGTAVAGIAGAVGNNEVGVTGLSWKVKMMLVTRGNTTSDAILAYTYPYLNRKLFNETDGQKGAFIVATNSSWGIDFGTPEDAPLWCAMYDSLGSVGILNAAATTNANYDVEQAGDLPTTCRSDYLVTTTSSNNWGGKMVNAGYGAQSIDLSAFGECIFTTFNNNTYGKINGTSAAAPQIAATIALLHTAPCPDFATLAKFDPAVAALTLKDYILQGAEPHPSLDGITVSGGNLNAFNSLDILMDNCAYAGCFPPFSINVDPITTSEVAINWTSAPDITSSVNLQYRPIGSSSWLSFTDVQSPFLIQDLQSCTQYEFRLESICNTGIDLWTETFTFETDGCCYAPDFTSFEPSSTDMTIKWNPITAALQYELNYRKAGTIIWLEELSSNDSIIIPDLLECQEYEFRIRTICNSIESDFSSIYTFKTSGCDACLEADYCPSYGAKQSFTYIKRVKINNIDNISGVTESGFQDFTDELSVDLIKGGVHEIELNSGFEFLQFPGFFRVWIDINQDGVFSTDELRFRSDNPELSSSGSLFIPPWSNLGSTRMRVSFRTNIGGPCDIASEVGEVEDYCVNIMEPTECLAPANFQTLVNDNFIEINWSGNTLIDAYIFEYREWGSLDWNTSTTTNEQFTLFNLLPCTDYEYKITSICGTTNSEPSPSSYFTTQGCGTCLDQTYCGPTACSVDFEWIEKITVNSIENISGANNGYHLFSGLHADFRLGEIYPIELVPGFANDIYRETFNAWIDFNQDGTFDPITEKVFSGVSFEGEPLNKMINIPEDALIGSTRMRISMKYDAFVENPCESGFFGEVEEYCINIRGVETMVCNPPEFSNAVPLDTTTVEIIWPASSSETSYRLRYRPYDSLAIPWQFIITGNEFCVLDNLKPCQEYEVEIQTICEQGLSEFGANKIIEACLVLPVNTVAPETNFDVFPNPFADQVYLNIETLEAGQITAEVYSSVGQLVQRQSFEISTGNNRFDLDLSQVSNGIYFLKIIENQTVIGTRKLIHQAP